MNLGKLIPVLDQFLSRYKNDKLSLAIQKNISWALLLKMGSAVCVYLTIPILIKSISAERYGQWVTLASLIPIISILDLGLGNWLKNTLARSVAQNQTDEAKELVSSVYFIFGLIMILLILTGVAITAFFNWDFLLSSKENSAYLPNVLVGFVIIVFTVQFLLRLINAVFAATHENYFSYAMNFSTNVTILIVSVIFYLLSVKNIWIWFMLLSCAPVLVLTAFSFYYFGTRGQKFSPSIQGINTSRLLKLTYSSLPFFIGSLCSVILFSTDSLIINHFFNP